MKRALGLWLAAVPLWAHVMSMSSGDLTIDGAAAHYELRMPLYEITHVQNPERALLEHIRFGKARQTAQNCRPDPASNQYLCSADYEFPSPVQSVEVQCDFYAITVPNHVHLLRAQLGGKRDEGVFDLTFTRTTLRFRPPTQAEIVVTEAGAGAVRALSGMAQILFLAALALAARGRRELASLAAMFLAGQAAGVLIMARILWQPAPRFVEAAAALTVAYLAIEILLLPQAGSRWLVAGILGGFHGLYFHLFLQNTGYSPGLVLTGAAVAELAVLTVLALAFSKIGRIAKALRPLQVAATGLLVFGLVWFAMRLVA